VRDTLKLNINAMQVALKFVKRQSGIAKQSGRPYDFIILSNGLMAGNASIAPHADIPPDLQEGEDVLVSFNVHLNRDRFEPTVTAIERA